MNPLLAYETLDAISNEPASSRVSVIVVLMCAAACPAPPA